MSGMHYNPCRSLQECGNRNLENVSTTHIIVFSIEGQASTRMQFTEPTYIVAKWGVGLEAAIFTLECTTQRRLQTVEEYKALSSDQREALYKKRQARGHKPAEKKVRSKGGGATDDLVKQLSALVAVMK